MDPQKYFSIFKNFVETSSLGYGFSDLDGNVIYANPALCRMLDLEKDEDMLGTKVASYYPKDTQKMLVSEILPIVKEKGGWYGELLFQSCKGTVANTLQDISLIKDENGKPLFFGNIITDITERKKFAKELEKEKGIAEKYLDIVKVMIVGLNFKKEVVLVNKKGCEVLGYEEGEILGKNWFDHFIPGRLREEVN
ncbi:MAG: PAS domain-containing protein, partial [Candidatus Omnitrophica bacterium]|nr:PAS domain-containing protein [Candidatus Omnitrophota bacterium]